MATRFKKHRKPWAPEHLELLQQMAAEKLPLAYISHKLGRTESAIKAQASSLGLQLKPAGKKRLETSV
jgi:hypothetical protein